MLNESTTDTADSINVISKEEKPPVLSIIVPTRNEAKNVEPLLKRISTAITALPIEVIFVDDSTDNTPEVIAKLKAEFALASRSFTAPSNDGMGSVTPSSKA